MKQHLKYFAIATALILLIPLIAMQFTEEVDWKLGDFIIIGALLFGTGLAYELISKNVKTRTQKRLVAIGLSLLLIYIWAELAVGIFTNIGS